MGSSIKKIIVLSSGGDAPGMNAAIRAVVRTALFHSMEVYGAEGGFGGLVKHKVFPLTSRSVANCIQRGGTILKTGRFPEFQEKSVRDKTREFLTQESVDALVIL